jgi:hypothetical protein
MIMQTAWRPWIASCTATVLLIFGVPERTVMRVMGWSSTSWAARPSGTDRSLEREGVSSPDEQTLRDHQRKMLVSVSMTTEIVVNDPLAARFIVFA